MPLEPKQDLAVLIVEDEPRLRELLVRATESWGFTTTGARTAEEALKIMAATPHQIAVLDINLPGPMNGIECLEAIHERWPGTQAIILTGFGDLESAKKAIHLDAVDFLTKPCHLGELEVAIDRAKRRIAAPGKPRVEVLADEPPPQPSHDKTPATTLEDLEREAILSALGRHHGNRAATAAELGISLRTLYYRLGEYQQKGYMKT
jgi:DNA-binding NtrC family response regulator